jgi:teichuronic acid biosynthesis glycosyltransferase TuaH
MTSTHPVPQTSRSQPTATSDVVFTFSYESLRDAQKRGMMRPPDRLAAMLMSDPSVRRMLIADPFRPRATAWARDLVDYAHRPKLAAHVHHVSPLRWRRTDPVELAPIENVYVEYERIVRTAAERGGLREPVFITANPLVAGFAHLDWAGPALYYARDDWLSSPARRPYWPAYQRAYENIARSGRAVAAVSQEIIDRIAPHGPHRVVPNGIEPAEWLGEQPPEPEWFARIPGPRAVYVGTLDSRLDVEGIERLAAARPGISIILIGPAPQRDALAAVRSIPNVHIHGRIGRREVIAVLRNADITLLAHRRTALTEAMSPLKVYEYLAAGRSVLATDLRPVHGMGDRVHLADSVSDFVDLIDDALAAGIQDETERQAYIAANAWATRHREIMALVET